MPEIEADEPEAFAPFKRAFDAEVDDVDAGKRWVVARIGTAAVDKLKTVVDPAGMDKADFLKNPVVLWEHGLDRVRGRVPIGRSAWLKPAKGGTVTLAKTIFADDEFSRGLFDLYKDRVLRGWSIYGRPSKAPGKVGPPTAAELRARPELADCKTVYRSWTLFEYSAVSVPANADALTEAVSRGLWLPESLRGLAAAADPKPAPPANPLPNLPPLRGRTKEDVEAAVMRAIRTEADAMLRAAYQDALDLARGKV